MIAVPSLMPALSVSGVGSFGSAVPVQEPTGKRENTMERQIADGTLQNWESPTVTEIRVSAEVTAYADIWDGAD